MRFLVDISKDEDFVFLAHRSGDSGKLLWVRLGNCRRAALIQSFDLAMAAIVAAFESGQNVVELGCALGRSGWRGRMVGGSIRTFASGNSNLWAVSRDTASRLVLQLV